VDADDVTRSVTLARDTLATAAGRDWQVPAGTLEWTCWETVEHVSDVLFGYAAQLSGAASARNGYVPYAWSRRRESGPPLSIHGDVTEGPSGLIDVLQSSGDMLAAMVATAPADRVSFHNYGPSDPSGFAAMGVVETLLHTHDVAAGLGIGWHPPADLCASALRRLFPAAETTGTEEGTEPWATLLDVTGRGPVPRAAWRWDGTPR
jgi:hypothetical protein